MTRTTPIEDFRPGYEPITLYEIAMALIDLNPIEANSLMLAVPLPYTRREDGTIDVIAVGVFNPGNDWMVYTGRTYGGHDFVNITSTVAQCPGHMVVLVVRALYTYLTAIGPRGRAETVEGDILYALGLVRPITAAEG